MTSNPNEGATYDWSEAIQEAYNVIVRYGPGSEACGFIEDSHVVCVENTERKPSAFAMSEADCERVYDALERRVLNGVWHSHPSGSAMPSRRDWLNQPRGVDMYIIALSNQQPPEVVRYDDVDRAAQ